ncbi:ATP-dependent (S)-NAD(P)H-hydrate dehydratase isoform X2 [Orcinus orca]|uniref:ATP-dependent (S)-NAD(P)H-hydrate dehydratase isoform X2 n=1 Tax=Orcinus orca TaxID=9733 RepID=UPI002111D8E3|nr:ATP-dependent (S)-NAD(P)H-hydrate dehydratase isoform X2 [Orcinus orca]
MAVSSGCGAVRSCLGVLNRAFPLHTARSVTDMEAALQLVHWSPLFCSNLSSQSGRGLVPRVHHPGCRACDQVVQPGADRSPGSPAWSASTGPCTQLWRTSEVTACQAVLRTAGRTGRGVLGARARARAHARVCVCVWRVLLGSPWAVAQGVASGEGADTGAGGERAWELMLQACWGHLVWGAWEGLGDQRGSGPRFAGRGGHSKGSGPWGPGRKQGSHWEAVISPWGCLHAGLETGAGQSLATAGECSPALPQVGRETGRSVGKPPGCGLSRLSSPWPADVPAAVGWAGEPRSGSCQRVGWFKPGGEAVCGSGGPGALAAGSRLEEPGGRPGAEWRALRMVLEEPVPGARHEASAPSVGSPVRGRRQPERGCWGARQAVW